MLVPFTPEPFLVDIPDLNRGGVRFMQKAEWLGLSTDVSPRDNSLMIVLKTMVHPYDTNGVRLVTEAIPSRPVELYAKNDTACYFNPADPTDPRNGEIISQQGATGLSVWEAELEALPIPVIKQGNLFSIMMQHPAVLMEMIRLEIIRASLPPFSKYA